MHAKETEAQSTWQTETGVGQDAGVLRGVQSLQSEALTESMPMTLPMI